MEVLTGGGNLRHVLAGDTLFSNGGGANEIYIESGGFVTQEGGGANIAYVKEGGQYIIRGGGGSNQTYYEPNATIVNELQGGGANIFTECSEIIFIE